MGGEILVFIACVYLLVTQNLHGLDFWLAIFVVIVMPIFYILVFAVALLHILSRRGKHG